MRAFLDMSKSVTIEVAAGRLSVEEAKARLHVNANIVIANIVRQRVSLWNGRKVTAWDNYQEKQMLEEEE